MNRMNTTRSDISHFIGQVMLFLIPLFTLGAAYIWLDPFKVVHSYDKYYPAHCHGGVGLNAGYVSTVNFTNHLDEMHYDSFIFGNSRSVYYEVADWLKFLPKGCSPYHFDASAETIYGIERKVRFINRKGAKMRNALMVIDVSVLAHTAATEGHLYSLPPQLNDYRNLIAFHAGFFGVFLNPKFAYAVADYKLSGKMKEYMIQGGMLSDEDFYYDYRHNEYRNTLYERQIKERTYFSPKRLAVFSGTQHPDSVSPAVIGSKQKELLRSIRHIFAQHGTDYRIVISPLYDQIKISPADLAALKELFGTERVFDFSGANKYNADYHNYYEQSHYRPIVARDIMHKIYDSTPSSSAPHCHTDL